MAEVKLSEESVTVARVGRKPIYVEPVRRSAYLERETYEGIRTLGNGSFSQGICLLWLSHSASPNFQHMCNED